MSRKEWSTLHLITMSAIILVMLFMVKRNYGLELEFETDSDSDTDSETRRATRLIDERIKTLQEAIEKEKEKIVYLSDKETSITLRMNSRRVLVVYHHRISQFVDEPPFIENLNYFLDYGITPQVNSSSIDFIILLYVTGETPESHLAQILQAKSTKHFNVQTVVESEIPFDKYSSTFMNHWQLISSNYDYMVYLNSNMRGPFLPVYWTAPWWYALISQVNSSSLLFHCDGSCSFLFAEKSMFNAFFDLIQRPTCNSMKVSLFPGECSTMKPLKFPIDILGDVFIPTTSQYMSNQLAIRYTNYYEGSTYSWLRRERRELRGSDDVK